MREAAQRDTAKSLSTVVATSYQALVSWFEEEQRTARILADNEAVRTYAQKLLKVRRNRNELLSAPAQQELRSWFAPVLVTKEHQGFFLVALDGVSIASARDENVGTDNLLIQQENFLEAITSGNTMMSLPLRSDVPLVDRQGNLTEGLPTMFVGAPVRDDTSKVIAALLFRIDPQRDFSSILRRGRIGTSGETYTFDSNGSMISEARFIPDLGRIGILPPGAEDSLGLTLRDPGVNLAQGEAPEQNRDDRPLTLMARSATAKQSGQNLDGYRDYRGVPVVGAWLWNDDLNWGITTELDVDEAYEALSSNLAIIQSATFVVVALVMLILLTSSVSRYRVVASELRYRSLFSNTNDAIVIADPVSRQILDVNDRASDELLYSPAELLELEVFDLFQKANIDEALANWERLTTAGRVLFETDILRKDGTSFDAEISISLAKLEGGTVCQAFIRDITRRKVLEEKLSHSQKMETVGTLAGGVAHDFNNLLMPIIGNAQLIAANTDETSDLQTYTDRIIGAGNRAAALVSQLLTLGHKLEPDMALVKLPPILHDATRLLRTSIPLSISLKTDIDESCEEITADASQIHQVIMNLCINASHAMEETGGELKVSLHPVQADDAIVQMVDNLVEGSYVKIAISDTGHGMDAAVRRQIFDPFFSTKKEGKGTGLGLSTVHNIVTSHGGHITVYSEVGIGSTFDIYLPFSKDSSPVSQSGKERITGGCEHILVVDDNVENTSMMDDMLTQLGYLVTPASSGADALRLFKDNKFDIDLLITDFAMPNMNGDVLIQAIREIRPDTPVVMMSGFGAALSMSKLDELGVSNLLNKPFTREDLDRSIRKALD